MNELLTSNEWSWRLARTIVQGVLGVVVANVDMLVGCAVLEPEWRVVVVALVMAVLSPVMAELGAALYTSHRLRQQRPHCTQHKHSHLPQRRAPTLHAPQPTQATPP